MNTPPKDAANGGDGAVDEAPPFELFSWAVWRDPYSHFATLRDRHPVFRHPLTPFWIFSRYEDVNAILTDPVRFSSRFPGNFDKILNGSDAPEHTEVRRRLSPMAARQSVAALEASMSAHAHAVLDTLAAAGECDFISDFAQPLPFRVMASWLGLDPALYDECVGNVFPFLMAEPMMEGESEPLVDQGELEKHYLALLGAEIDAFETEPRDGLLPGLLKPENGAPPLERDAVLQLAKILLFAGQKTSACAIGNSLWLLLKHPHILEALRAEPGLMANFVEESIRLESPVQSLFRITLTETEFGGRTFPPFSFIRTLVGAANRDPKRIADADEIRLDRAEKTHLGLGLGPHMCLGAHLARVILNASLTAVVERMEDIEARVPLDEVDRIKSPNFRGIKTLPIAFRAT